MKVIFDHQCFSLQNYGGISRYFTEIIKNYRTDNDIDIELLVKYSNNSYLHEDYIVECNNFEPTVKYPTFFSRENLIKRNLLTKLGFKFLKAPYIISNRYIGYINKKYNQINMSNNIKFLMKQEFDVFHPTYYDPYFLDYIGNKPYVITVYDMIHEILSDRFSGLDNKTIEYKKRVINRSSKIIAISENTKRDLIKLYGIDEDKIAVIHLGFSDFNNLSSNIKTPEKFLLYVGNRYGYKNFNNFIIAVASLIREQGDLFVVCAGCKGFDRKEMALLKELDIEDRVLHYMIDDSILSFLYKRALAFVFPSLYEGFGIPILEAFATGCPVLLSDSSSFPEVAGDAGLYFDPKSNNSMRDVIKEVVSSEALRNELRAKGFKQVANFRWEKTARETKALYKSLL